MRTCIYISGPPCSGKSTLASAIRQMNSEIEYILGDNWWTLYPELSFSDRVAITNKHILDALTKTTSNCVLCEWVPWRGSFVSAVYETSLAANRRFLHVVLTAPDLVLKQRKLKRDSNQDQGSATKVKTTADRSFPVLMFCTHKYQITTIVDHIFEWLRQENNY